VIRRDAAPRLHVLSLNTGSSSFKFGLYRVGVDRAELLMSGEAEGIDDPAASFHARDADGHKLATTPSQCGAVVRLAMLLDESDLPSPDVIGHRIVHGGPHLREHVLIEGDVLDRLDRAAAFAPLHTPPALAVIRFAQEHFPGVAQVACFDTAFHAGLPDVARMLPIPLRFRAEGVERYGFHGLSCESILARLDHPLPRRLIVAHLGNGASVTAIRDGRSIDTSMGFTPTGGVIMGTRSGDIDPGVLIYLMREHRLDAAMLEDLIDHRSGLLGISGVGGDMRALRRAAPTNADADLAIRMFCASVRKQIAAMAAALEGVDMLVFTGGIGEHDAEARASICGGLSWLGIDIDASGNIAARETISAPGSTCAVRVLRSDEDRQIARHAWQVAVVDRAS